MAAAQSSIYEKFIILSADGQNRADIANAEFRVTSFDYYENILSPFITGTVIISSTSGAAKSKDDKQNRSGSLHSSLPLRAGCQLLVKIKNEIGEPLDFSVEDDEYKKLYVTDVKLLTVDSTSETVQVRFSSRTAWLNETNKVVKSYSGKISDSVKKILKDELSFEDSKIKIDPSTNSYKFLGMNKRPLDLIAMLCIRSIPSNVVNPGYFCYETKSGFNYLSADTLINQDPFERIYKYSGQPIATAETKDDSNDYKIASFNTTQHQDLLSQIRSGVFSSKNVFFNPTTCVFTEIDITVEDKKLTKDPKFSTLGKKEDPPPFLFGSKKGGKRYHRVQSAIFDVGTDSGDVNNSPELYYAGGSTRYNLLFSQVYSASVPCNTDLEAGHVLKLEIESNSQDKEQGPDQVQSGNYIIQALHHHFEPNKSTTSMNLIRDSYGLHFTKPPSAPAVSPPKSSAKPSPKPPAKPPEKSAETNKDTRTSWQRRLDARRGRRN
jgi:hypothetical protein